MANVTNLSRPLTHSGERGRPATQEGRPLLPAPPPSALRKRKATGTHVESAVDHNFTDENVTSLNQGSKKKKPRVQIVEPSRASPRRSDAPSRSGVRHGSLRSRAARNYPNPGPLLLRTIHESVDKNPHNLLQCATAEINDEISAFLNTQTMWKRDMHKAEVEWAKAIGIPMPMDLPYRTAACAWRKYSSTCILCCTHSWNRNSVCCFPNPNPNEDIYSAPGCEGGNVFLWSHGPECG